MVNAICNAVKDIRYNPQNWDIISIIIIFGIVISMLYFFIKEIEIKVELKNKNVINKIILIVFFTPLWIIDIIKNKIQKTFEKKFMK